MLDVRVLVQVVSCTVVLLYFRRALETGVREERGPLSRSAAVIEPISSWN